MQKQKAKQMFFGLFSFIKQELKKTKHNYQNPNQNETEFQAQTSRMLPKLIRLTIARSIRAREDQISANQPRQIVQTRCNKKLQRSKKSSSKIATKP